jgi:putative membrane protein
VIAFLGGLVALWIAAGPPLAHMEQAHLTAHMLQHLIIMTIAAPLLLIGAPVRLRLGHVHPVLCWLAGTVVVIAWHVPALFAIGMRWHAFQHATFLAGGLLFWAPVLQASPRWTTPLYLFLATMPCDALSAFLTFCGRVVYPHEHGAHGAALADQARAGALMWFWVTIAYLVPAAVVTIRLISPSSRRSDHRGGW